ncbi:MAG: glycosyl hydrolase [Alistipes sp. 58_9_plus]|nr:MAG: glycosyl hydrolase [Alistipes sp. 58_9_plus]
MKRQILILSAAAMLAGCGGTQPQQSAQQPQQSMEQQVDQLLDSMNVDEKIGQMMNSTPGIERLGIKPYDWWNEGLHGVGRSGRATVFPQPIGLGATFDIELLNSIGDAISDEARAKYQVAQRIGNYGRYAGLTFWSPNVNIFRDPRWGRGMETYGEDPYLTGMLGTAFVKGLQGDDPNYLKAAACAKHFAVHSGPEATRHGANVEPSLKDLYETYLPAFEMLVKDAKVETVMTAYNAVYGDCCSASPFLMQDILRNRWNFKGHIVSDCGAVTDIYTGHHCTRCEMDAAVKALKAGLNLECGSSMRTLKDAYAKQLITEEDLDNALRPTIMTRLKLGILHDDPQCPYNNMPEDALGSPEHRALAKRAATESMVLLKNDGILPLDKNIHSLNMSGSGATDIFYQMGNYYGLSDTYSTYLQGIVSKVSAGTTVSYHTGFMQLDGLAANMNIGEAAGADVAIVFMGNNGNVEGEEGESIANSTSGDRLDLRLPESQMNYLRTLKRYKGEGIVVVLTGGSPIDLREIYELADAVVMAWYSGQAGGEALGDLLFGDANFSGRLPVTFPAETEKLPPFEDYSMAGRTYKYMTDNILFPFGYGLSYGKVTYGPAKVVSSDDKNVTVEFTLSNDGTSDVDEIVQLYHSSPAAGVTAPLKAGEKRTVRMEIPVERLSTVQEDGTKKLLQGTHSLHVASAAPTYRSADLGVQDVTVTLEL